MKKTEDSDGLTSLLYMLQCGERKAPINMLSCTQAHKTAS